MVPTGTIGSVYPYSESGKYMHSKEEDIEQLTTMSFVAARTNKIRILSAVMVLPYRPPILSAKMLSTIDYLSEGRLTVGVGVGWLKEEFDILDVPFEERGVLADEYIQVLRNLWSHRKASFHGKFCSFTDLELVPRPVQKPHPPIWVGGESTKAMKRAAKFGDGWLPIGANPSFPLDSPERMKLAIRRLHKYMRDARRQSGDVEIGYMVPGYRLVPDSQVRNSGPFSGSAQKIKDSIREFEKIGVSFLGFSLREETLQETLNATDKFASEILPAIHRK